MNRQDIAIDVDHGRNTLRAAARGVRSEEYEARQEMVARLNKMRLDGYTYEQIAQSLSAGGISIDASEVEIIVKELVYGSALELIRTADELIRQCPTDPVSEPQWPTSDNATKVPRCHPLHPDVGFYADRPALRDLLYTKDPMEHPAILGLMLSVAERMYMGHLVIVDSNGVTRKETPLERDCRINWKKPTP